MPTIDYNHRLYQNYHRGIATSQDTSERCIAAIRRRSNASPEDIILDLGSRTGRFSTWRDPQKLYHIQREVIGINR